jgi:FkbM family methyltransferase
MNPRRWAGSALSKAGGALKRLSRAVWTPAEERRARPWFEVDGDHTLRLDYPLHGGSLVYDLGGYRGQWASDIVARFGCAVHVFEPVPAFADFIRRRFERNPRVVVHEFALGAADGEIAIAVRGDASSALRGRDATERCRAVRASEFLRRENVAQVDLMKVNIEGAEYDLLDHLLDESLASRFVNLQVQFHEFVPDAKARRSAIRERLAATHEPAWTFEFVWESWRRRGG